MVVTTENANGTHVVETISQAEFRSTVTHPGEDGTRRITLDVIAGYGVEAEAIATNLTEDECKAVIRALVASLNEYQRGTP